jgi:hypothetical protein
MQAEYVCTDELDRADWYYIAKEGLYTRKSDGRTIRGHNLPDPDKLWALRCDELGTLEEHKKCQL